MTSSSCVKIALVGVGGYGGNFVSLLTGVNARPDVQFVAAVDPKPEITPQYAKLVEHGVPLFPSMEAMYTKVQPDIVVISSPIHLHAQQTITALEHGSHVFCEKPLGCSNEQVAAMIAARDKAKKQVAIGYQWNFSAAIQTLKADVIANRFGGAVRASGLCFYPRGEVYFQRNRWAGRKTVDGMPVFDSPVNNACAHFLQILFYVLGDAADRAASPAEVTAELYRANPIENYDTAALRCRTTAGTDVLFFTSHSTPRLRGPLLRFEFEHAKVSFDETSGQGIIAQFTGGQTRYYGTASSGVGKLWRFVDAVKTGGHVTCPLEAAACQTYAMTAAQQSEIVDFPRALIDERELSGKPFRVVKDLEETLLRCLDQHKLPSEMGVSWAKVGKTTKA